MSNPLKQLEKFGQSPWIDMISRDMLTSGELKRLLDEDGAKGLTSNPSIFEKAIGSGSAYDDAIAAALARGITDTKTLFEELAIRDIRDAADLLLPVYEGSAGADGFVSLEVSPRLAYDTEATITEGQRLFKQVDRKNLMIKVPATKAGLPAITRLIGAGINVNVTLIFSIARYREVMDAYLSGLEALAKAGRPLSSVASVASFFVSRLDAAFEKQAVPGSPLIGKVGVANSKLAYQAFLEVFAAPRFKNLQDSGARVQRPLWASTGTKNPTLPDVLYINELIGPDTVNTIPPKTWDAFRDHGQAAQTVTTGIPEAQTVLDQVRAAGIDLDEITEALEIEGVESFIKSFEMLLEVIRVKSEKLTLSSTEKKTADRLDPADVVSRLWAKDSSLWKEEAVHKAVIACSLGWLDMPRVMPDRLQEIQSFTREIRDAGLRHVVVLGMGGSSLAPEVFRRTMPTSPGSALLHVLDSTEPESVLSIAEQAESEHTLYIVASKSGTTVEPMRFFDYFYGKLKELKGAEEAGKHFIAITDPESPLVQTAKELRFRKIFQNFPDIGGRYSALSYFGLVPAALAGVDLKTLLERTRKMAEACTEKSSDNPGFSLGEALGRHAAGGRDKVHCLLPRGLESFGLWVEQLVAESTGKEGKGIVPLRGEAPPADDKIFIHWRIGSQPDKDSDAAAEALRKKGCPVIAIELSDIYDLGAEFFRWEFATAVAGRSLGINPFDQPNVQSAKEKTVSLLMELKRNGVLPKADPHVRSDGLGFTFSARCDKSNDLTGFLSETGPGDYIGLLSYICSDGRYESEVEQLRLTLERTSGLSVQAGYGPRYLHSTGQLHKGGANNGVFLILSRTEGPSVPIPGADYSFAQLVQAQALGDFRALEAENRRAVLIRFKGGVKEALESLNSVLQTALKV